MTGFVPPTPGLVFSEKTKKILRDSICNENKLILYFWTPDKSLNSLVL